MTRPQAIATAIEMWEDGEGWSIPEIRKYLASHGQTATVTTIKMWVDPVYRAQRLETMRDRHRLWARGKRGTVSFRVIDEDARERLADLLDRQPARATDPATPEVLLALRLEDGLAYPTIAKVARRFLGLELTAEQVRYQLLALGAPKNPNKVRLGHERNPMRAAA